MQKESKKAFEEFCRRSMASGAKIEFSSMEEKCDIRLEGSSAMLFHGACEIVKQLAILEGKERPGIERGYLNALCSTVLEELEERAEKPDIPRTSAEEGAKQMIKEILADMEEEA